MISVRPLAVLICCFPVLVLSGCGSEDAPADAESEQQSQSQQTTPVDAQANSSTQPTGVAVNRSSDTQWIGGIPYDVFYDKPLEVAADGTLLATAGASGTAPQVPDAGPTTTDPGSSETQPMTNNSSPSSAGGEIDWEKVAPMEQVVEEITTIRNELQEKLNTVATYNKAYTEIGIDSIVLASLAGVVERHPGDVSWKPHAKIVRDLASDISLSAVKTGRSAFDESKAPYENIVDVLNGNSPPDRESEEKSAFGDYADRVSLMERMSTAHTHLKSNVNTEDRLKEDPAAVKRKLTLLATLATIVSTDSYDFTEEKEYQAFIGKFINAAVDGRAAVDANDFATYQNAVATMQSACTECHAKYAFAEAGGF